MKQTYFAVGVTLAIFVLTQALLPVGNDWLLPVLYALIAIMLPKWLFCSASFGDLPRPTLRIPTATSALVLLLTPLFVLLTFGASELSLWLAELCGYTNTVLYEGSFLSLVFLHALLPALTEEMVFRHYLPSWLSPFGKKRAIWISAIFFALLHTPAAMPYALLAGLILGCICEASGTPFYAIFMHFCNNAFSLYLIKNASTPIATRALILMGALALLGLGLMMLLKKGRTELAHLFQKATYSSRDVRETQHE